MAKGKSWAFVLTDPKCVYPAVLLVLGIGLLLALHLRDASQFNRVGSFIIIAGVWMSMRYTLRVGLHRSLLSEPRLAVQIFNEIRNSRTDAWLGVHGLILMVIGSMVGSYGDFVLKSLFPCTFR